MRRQTVTRQTATTKWDDNVCRHSVTTNCDDRLWRQIATTKCGDKLRWQTVTTQCDDKAGLGRGNASRLQRRHSGASPATAPPPLLSLANLPWLWKLETWKLVTLNTFVFVFRNLHFQNWTWAFVLCSLRPPEIYPITNKTNFPIPRPSCQFPRLKSRGCSFIDNRQAQSLNTNS